MNMKELFSHLKFDVMHRSDVLAEEIVQLLEEVLAKEEYLNDSDCFVFVISTHGSEIPLPDGNSYQHQLSCTDKTLITTQEIVNMVSKCKALEGKPKLFFIQACRIRGKIDKNTQVGRDPGLTVLVKKEDS
ncbi:hypothetical protein CHS0354_033121 [Potamilus streckersoni]|uniref:Caspase family p20 domain-containing protein n=1 Tax=Potamilus streckersoni TaxID=2493646 RepID=A0AAE0VQ16_9BIVA|nr:hypothetical protein CHS0354_033121 [Potamilus streckersoni]